MRCRAVLLALLFLAWQRTVRLPAAAEAFFPDASYRTEAESPAVADAGEIVFVSAADLAPRGTRTEETPERTSPGNSDGGDELFLFRPGAPWPFTQLTHDGAASRKSHVAIGRDGRAVAWVERQLSGQGGRVWLLPLGRRQPALVARGGGLGGVVAVSDRLPHGYRLAYSEATEGGGRVRVTDLYLDPEPRSVPCDAVAGQEPTLSRDGARLAYTAPDAAGHAQIHVRHVGGEEQVITAGDVDSARPRISGDGLRVAFESFANLAILNRDGNREIFLYDTTTRRKKLTQITRTDAGVENRSPRVNGDGTRVAFLSNGNLMGKNADGNEEVFLWIAGAPPQLRQVTDTRPEPVADPSAAPYPIASRALALDLTKDRSPLTLPKSGRKTLMAVQLTAIYKKVPEGYIAFVPELPGANSQGATLDETRSNLEEAVQLVIEANRLLAEEQLQGEEVIREPLGVVA